MTIVRINGKDYPIEKLPNFFPQKNAEGGFVSQLDPSKDPTPSRVVPPGERTPPRSVNVQGNQLVSKIRQTAYEAAREVQNDDAAQREAFRDALIQNLQPLGIQVDPNNPQAEQLILSLFGYLD